MLYWYPSKMTDSIKHIWLFKTARRMVDRKLNIQTIPKSPHTECLNHKDETMYWRDLMVSI